MLFRKQLRHYNDADLWREGLLVFSSYYIVNHYKVIDMFYCTVTKFLMLGINYKLRLIKAALFFLVKFGSGRLPFGPVA